VKEAGKKKQGKEHGKEENSILIFTRDARTSTRIQRNSLGVASASILILVLMLAFLLALLVKTISNY